MQRVYGNNVYLSEIAQIYQPQTISSSEQGKIVLNYKSIGRYMVEGCNIPIIILRLIDYKGGMPS